MGSGRSQGFVSIHRQTDAAWWNHRSKMVSSMATRRWFRPEVFAILFATMAMKLLVETNWFVKTLVFGSLKACVENVEQNAADSQQLQMLTLNQDHMTLGLFVIFHASTIRSPYRAQFMSNVWQMDDGHQLANVTTVCY